MVKRNLFLENIDLIISLFFLVILTFSSYKGWITSPFIEENTFFQLYILIFGAIAAVMAIFLSLDEKLFYVIEKRKLKTLTFNIFKFPIAASVLGLIVTTVNKRYENLWVFFINTTILIYIILSSFECFKFVFKISYGIKVKKAENMLKENK